MRIVFAIAVAAATAISVPAFAQTAGAPGAVGTGRGLTGSNTPGGGVSANGSYGRELGYHDYGYSGAQSQPTWSVNYNRQGFNPAWSYEPHPPGPGYNDNGYSGEQSQPTWSVNYNRQGFNPTWSSGW
jgi:hypothetical protein